MTQWRSGGHLYTPQGTPLRTYPFVTAIASGLGMAYFIMNPELFPHANRSFLRWYARCMIGAAILSFVLMNMAEQTYDGKVWIRITWIVLGFVFLCLLCLAAAFVVLAAVN